MRRFATAIASFLAVIAVSAPPMHDDSDGLPDNPMGKVVAAWIELVNTGDADAVRRFESENRSESALKSRTMEDRVELFTQLKAEFGKLEFRKVLESGEHTLSVLVQASNVEGVLTLRFEFEDEKPHKLNAIRIQRAESADAAAKQMRTYEQTGPLSELLESVRGDCGAPAVAAAVVRCGKIVETAVVGRRRRDQETVCQADDRFHIGSVSKSMTATVVASLIEQGKLNWNTTLAEALPGVDMKDEYRAVTIAQLLRHRAGIPQHMNFNQVEMNRLNSLPGGPTEQRAAYVAEVLQQRPIAAPGEAVRYSNAGYAIAGLIAERASGKTWQELIQALIFDKLGMKHSGFGWPASKDRPDQPYGHFGVGETARVQEIGIYPLGEFMAPAGNVHCSIDDLARYAAAHLSGLRGGDGILRSENVKRLHDPRAFGDEPTGTKGDASAAAEAGRNRPAGSPMDEKYACGWVIDQTADGKAWHWHNGSAGTFYAAVCVYPDDDLAIVVASNAAGKDSVEPFLMKAAAAIRKRQLRHDSGR